ncbi:hypothetical protein [uncultured Oscillibacter sp.]|uniref:hypothetical protein n=1 Tax=uncultured Oscillibacter sp. TaxID=876091 RepID=UPI0026155753|nr:hypothetical protein [uncultured Oscillibacter sp.]
MEPVYITAESTVRPKEIEVGVTTVYLRRNIVETQHTDPMDEGREPTPVFIYEEAQLTKDEALLVLAEGQETHTKELEDADGINIDHEYRLTLLELGLSETDI